MYRERHIVTDAPGPEVIVDGRRMVNFCSNDYLGLAKHPQVVAAMTASAERFGAGAGASHLVSGHMASHHALETELAEFVNAPRALLFSTGYMANLGVVSALLGRSDAIFQDRLNHASLIDAGVLSRAKLHRYAHLDMQALAHDLAASDATRKLIASDGVFSMDGDLAPVTELIDLARRHDAWLLIDDAHGLGVLGEHGEGSFAAAGSHPETPTILMGTLGKAVGVFGAFVAGGEELIETLIQKARTYIYTTALPAPVADAVRASLQLIKTEPWRRDHLRALVRQFRVGAEQLGFDLPASDTPIQPVMLGSAEAALQASQHLADAGLWVSAIRPPTVAQNTARLRITFSAAHSEAQVERLLVALATLPRGPAT